MGSEAHRRIIARYKKALSNYQLIEDGDKILVGVSGGKDSLLLLELLGGTMRIHRPAIHVEALHVRMENITYETDEEYLERFAEECGIPMHVVTTSFDPSTDKRKTPCFLCSWYRRKELFNYAQEHGFNKIALGHHQDDIIHTALMNLLHQGQFSSITPRLKLDKMPLTLIRPLCMVMEKDIQAYAIERAYEKQKKTCPYDRDTRRTDIRQLFDKIEQMNSEARYSIIHALHFPTQTSESSTTE